MEWTVLFSSVTATIGSAAVGFAVSWGQNKEFKSDTKRRLMAAESAIKEMQEEVLQTRGTSKLFLEVMTDVKHQTNKIWEKLEKMDDELKEIYKGKR